MYNNTECLTSSDISTIILPMVYGMMFFPSVCGNILSLWIFRSLRKKTSTHIYLVNLAISNLVVTTGMPFHIAYYRHAQFWPENSPQCMIVFQTCSIITHSSMCVSVTIFCWIAISRYATLVRHKQRAQNSTKTTYEKIIFGQILKSFRNPRFACYLCIGVWVLILGPSATLFLVNKYAASGKSCFEKEAQIGQLQFKSSSATESTFFFIFFFTVLLFYYFFIKHIKILQANSCIEEKHIVYHKVKSNIIVIVGLLFVCFAPFHISKLLLVSFQRSQGCEHLSLLIEIKNSCLCLADFRSFTDPIVYFCLDDSFKKSILRMFKKHSNDHKDNSSTGNKNSTVQTVTATVRNNNIINK